MARGSKTTAMDKVKAAVLGTTGNGSLYRWLRQNHDEFADLLSQVTRPGWAKITAALSDENLLDAEGKAPSPERVRLTWLKVRTDVAAARAKKDRAQKSSAAISEHVRRSVDPKPVTNLKPAPPPDEPKSLSATEKELDDFRKRILDAGRYGGKDE